MDDVERVRAGNESPEARIAAIAEAQFGVFSRPQALDAGFSARQIQLRVTGKRWESRHRGVYRIVGARRSAWNGGCGTRWPSERDSLVG